MRKRLKMDVQTLYEELNQTFFEGKLRPYTVSLKSAAEMPNGLLGSVKHSGAFGPTIWIGKDVHRLKKAEGKTVRGILLHEMIHVKMFPDGLDEPPEVTEARRQGRWVPRIDWSHNTSEFQAELVRLASMGEAWAARELESYQICSRARAQTRAEHGLPSDRWCGEHFHESRERGRQP